jgi:hypothetical protein
MFRVAFILLSLMLFNFRPEPVKLIEASSESWTGGFKGSGRGVNYRVKIVVNRSSKVLSFDTLWVGERAFQVQASRPNPFNPQDGFSKKDTVIIYASLHQTTGQDGELLPLPAVNGKQVAYKGEALLSYWLKGKRHFLVIETFSELPSVDYP